LNQIKSIKGTHDILPSESRKWQELEKIVRDACSLHGYGEIRTPIIEKTPLFQRSVGQETDIVTKEMYSWDDRDGANITLRPELTASVARSFVQHNLGIQNATQRLYYLGPLFRRERPQKGRQRQFHQFGVEAFGSVYPEQDAEIISIAWHILSKCGLGDDVKLHLNSLGSEECRIKYIDSLKDFISPNINKFSKTSQRRFSKNTLRILDTKSEHEKIILKNAPQIADYLTDEDTDHFNQLQNYLTALKIPFEINQKLVRGLDYYSRTVFEFTTSALGSQDALLGGGRYDTLVERLGGKPTPGIGFAAGMERFLIAMGGNQKESSINESRMFFVCTEEGGIPVTLSLSQKLRNHGKEIIMDSKRRSMKAQLREANKINARYALILGRDEIDRSEIIIKDLIKGSQKKVAQSALFDNL
tara:strand:+ start:2191 stop:3441 length:1251 start_codon:yes stop_codon:yes gene_type:complete